jgi:serine/threonine protein phosphatase 1
MELENINNKKGRVFTMGDIHGAHKALVQCLERSGFDKENDTLIQLGDVADGWTEVYECVEELLTIKNLISIKGNHDEWFDQFLRKGVHPVAWLQGAEATAQSYARHADRPIHIIPSMGGFRVSLTYTDLPQSHINFFNKQHLYYKDDKDRLFVHGGFNRHETLSENKAKSHVFYWDRDLWMAALSVKQLPTTADGREKYSFKIKEPVTEVFIGHTATTNWNTDQPMQAANIWNLDTGAGFRGKLTIMDVETKEYFQSDDVSILYAHEKGRNNY